MFQPQIMLHFLIVLKTELILKYDYFQWLFVVIDFLFTAIPLKR